MTDGCAAITVIFLGSSRAPTPTGEIEIFVSATDGCGFCDRNELGRPMVAPTDEIYVDALGYKPNKDFYVALHN